MFGESGGSLIDTLGLATPASRARLEDLVRRLARGERWAALAGAGISAWSGVPDWDGLARKLAAYVGLPAPDDIAGEVYPDFLQECRDAATTDEEFHRQVAREVCGAAPHEIHDLVGRLPFAVVATLNYDCLLVEARRNLGESPEPTVLAYPSVKATELHSRSVVHLHGKCDCTKPIDERISAGTIVLSRHDYDLAYAQETSSLLNVLEALFDSYNVLFLGTSLRDGPTQELLNRLRRRREFQTRLGAAVSSTRHYALVPTREMTSDSHDWSWPGRAYNVEPIWYLEAEVDPKHLAFLQILRWLVDTSGRQLSTESMI